MKAYGSIEHMHHKAADAEFYQGFSNGNVLTYKHAPLLYLSKLRN